MLASVSGVCQLVLSILRLESYLYYLLPFPLVVAALRSGPTACRRTLVSTFFLSLSNDIPNVVGQSNVCVVLLGPPRAVAYVLLYGLVGVTLGILWHLRSPWWVTWPACTASYVAGVFSYVSVAGFFLKEDLFKLITYNVYTTVVGTPSDNSIK